MLRHYRILDSAKKYADQNPGYKVFNVYGNMVFAPEASESEVKVPFLVLIVFEPVGIGNNPDVS